MKKVSGIIILMINILTVNVMAQSMDKMNWENEPNQWKINNKSGFTMSALPLTDIWAVTQGFTVDNAHFYYGVYGGEFEVKVKVSAKFESSFDQAGLMIKQDYKNWIKTGFEYVDGKTKLSTVVTHNASDWSILDLDGSPTFIWLKIIRRINTLYVYYSYNDKEYTMMRTCWMEDNCPLKVGIMAASPEGSGFNAFFENYEVKHLPDLRRIKWAAEQQENGLH